MKVCLAAELYAPNLGGVEFALGSIVEGLGAEGIEVTVITSRFDRRLPARELNPRCTIVRVPVFPLLKRFWFIVSSLPSLFVHARACDLILGSTFAGAVPAALVGLLLHKRRVLIVHEIMGKQWSQLAPGPFASAFYRLAEWIIVRLPFHRFVAVSNYTKQVLISNGVTEEKIELIYHGDSKLPGSSVSRESVRAEWGFRPSDYVYFASGRAGISKGFDVLVEAIPEIVRQIPHARFILVFSKYNRSIWRRITRGLSRIPAELYRLSAPLSREKLADNVHGADCIVIPSRSEGFGFSAREACNAGKTVVATTAGSLPEVVHGNHVFVRPGSITALVDGCCKAYRGEVQEREPLEFDWKETCARYRDLCKRLVTR